MAVVRFSESLEYEIALVTCLEKPGPVGVPECVCFHLRVSVHLNVLFFRIVFNASAANAFGFKF